MLYSIKYCVQSGICSIFDNSGVSASLAARRATRTQPLPARTPPCKIRPIHAACIILTGRGDVPMYVAAIRRREAACGPGESATLPRPGERASERASEHVPVRYMLCTYGESYRECAYTDTPPSLPVRYPPAPVRYAHLAHLTHTEGGVPTCWHAAEQHPNNNPHMFCMVIIVGCC